MRPCASVAGTRCTRCTPDSQRSTPNAPSAFTLKMTSLMPPNVPGDIDRISGFHPRRRINQLLFSGEEGVADVADVCMNLSLGRARLKCVATSALDRRCCVLWVNICLHEKSKAV